MSVCGGCECACVCVCELQIKGLVLSFSPSSSGYSDHLLPPHQLTQL